MSKTIQKFAVACVSYLILLIVWSGIALVAKSKLESQIKFTLYSIYKNQFSTLVNAKNLTILLINDAKMRLDNKW